MVDFQVEEESSCAIRIANMKTGDFKHPRKKIKNNRTKPNHLA
jgi:hypothetical protein